MKCQAVRLRQSGCSFGLTSLQKIRCEFICDFSKSELRCLLQLIDVWFLELVDVEYLNVIENICDERIYRV